MSDDSILNIINDHRLEIVGHLTNEALAKKISQLMLHKVCEAIKNNAFFIGLTVHQVDQIVQIIEELKK